MTEVLTERVPLSMPTNIVAVGVNYVTVTVSILPVLSSRAMTGTVEIQGLRQEWTATISPETVDVILVGPDTLLSGLKRDDIQVFVNLFDLGLGVHRIEPIVLYPEGIELESVIPDIVEVTIRVEPTPAPPTSTLPIDTPTP
jgi:YbbR domain-containing protein